jgi:flavodoxin I
MKAQVLFESRTGNTKRAAELIATSLAELGVEVGVSPAGSPDLEAIAAADIVFIGTWVDGLVIAGHRPGDSRKLKRIPALWGKPVAAFMTYAIHPGNAISKLAKLLEKNQHCDVVTSHAFKKSLLPGGVDNFVEESLSAIGAEIKR